MKNSQQCPKCNSTEISKITTSLGAPKGFQLKGLASDKYICTSCGYTEDWIDKRKDLDTIKDKYGTNDLEQFV